MGKDSGDVEPKGRGDRFFYQDVAKYRLDSVRFFVEE